MHIKCCTGNNLILATGLMIGPLRIRIHLFRMKVVSDPTCIFCDDKNESTENIFATCEIVIYLKKKHLDAYQVLDRKLSLLTPRGILKFVQYIGLGEDLTKVYIIGHYNPSGTPLMLWRCLQFKDDSELQNFDKLFMTILFILFNFIIL